MFKFQLIFDIGRFEPYRSRIDIEENECGTHHLTIENCFYMAFSEKFICRISAKNFNVTIFLNTAMPILNSSLNFNKGLHVAGILKSRLQPPVKNSQFNLQHNFESQKQKWNSCKKRQEKSMAQNRRKVMQLDEFLIRCKNPFEANQEIFPLKKVIFHSLKSTAN